jgi:hypothetical protein
VRRSVWCTASFSVCSLRPSQISDHLPRPSARLRSCNTAFQNAHHGPRRNIDVVFVPSFPDSPNRPPKAATVSNSKANHEFTLSISHFHKALRDRYKHNILLGCWGTTRSGKTGLISFLELLMTEQSAVYDLSTGRQQHPDSSFLRLIDYCPPSGIIEQGGAAHVQPGTSRNTPNDAHD